MKKILILMMIVLSLSAYAVDEIVAGGDLTVTFLYNNGSLVNDGDCDLNLYNSSGHWNQLLTNQDMNEIGSTGIYNWTVPSTWDTVRYTGRADCNKSTHHAGTEIDFYLTSQDLDFAIHNVTNEVWDKNLSAITNVDFAGYRLFNLALAVWTYPSRLMTGGNITNIDYIEFIEFIEFIETLG